MSEVLAFGARLAAIRRAKGLDQKTIAARLGVTVACVSNWERGIRRPRAEDLPGLVAAYECGVEDLYPATPMRRMGPKNPVP